MPGAPTIDWDGLRERAAIRPLVYDGIGLGHCAAIAGEILALADSEPAGATNNVGGWKSHYRLLELAPAGGPLAQLAQCIEGAIGARPSFSWAMVNRSGSRHERHHHHNADLTMIYFVSCGDPPTPTLFEARAGEVAILPAVGRLVLCPGDMYHRVPRCDGHQPRITIAGDFYRPVISNPPRARRSRPG